MVTESNLVRTIDDAKKHIIRSLIHSNDEKWLDNAGFRYSMELFILRFPSSGPDEVEYDFHEVVFEEIFVKYITGCRFNFKKDLDFQKLRILKKELIKALDIDLDIKKCQGDCEFCVSKFFGT
jgi:hypothetical protein